MEIIPVSCIIVDSNNNYPVVKLLLYADDKSLNSRYKYILSSYYKRYSFIPLSILINYI